MPVHTDALIHPSLESRTLPACRLHPAPEFALYLQKIKSQLSIKSMCYGAGPCISPVFTGTATSGLKTCKKIVEPFPHEADLLDSLLHHGITVPHSFKRSRMQNYFSESQNLNDKKTISLYLFMSQSCNMGYTCCLNGGITYRTDKRLLMDKQVAFKSIERCLDDLSVGGRLEVIFFGGELMLTWTLAKESITYRENHLRDKNPGIVGIYYVFRHSTPVNNGQTSPPATVPITVQNDDSESPMEVVNAYYEALNRGDADEVIQRWWQPNANVSTLAKLALAADWHKIEDLHVDADDGEVSSVSGNWSGKSKNEKAQHYPVIIVMKKIEGQWKIVKISKK